MIDIGGPDHPSFASKTGKVEAKRDMRKYDIDFMRILAVFFVIYNHTPAYNAFSQFGTHTVSYWLCMMVSMLCNFNVPLFFMISGALLLKRNESIGHVLCHRFFWKFLSLVFFSAISYLQKAKLDAFLANPLDWLRMMYTTSENGAYWFLYSYLAFIICLPFVRRMAQGLTGKETVYFIVLCILFEPVYRVITYFGFNDELWINPSFNISWIETNFLFYCIWGYYLEMQTNRDTAAGKTKRLLYLSLAGTAVSVLVTALMTWLRFRARGDKGDATVYFHLFKAVYAATIFICVRMLCRKKSAYSFRKKEQLKKTIRIISEHVFGIYLIHAIYIRSPWVADIYTKMTETFKIHVLVSGLLYTLFVFLLSLFTAFVLRKIPIVRKIL